MKRTMKFGVGQVVNLDGDYYQISNRYLEEGELRFTIRLKDDTGYDSVEPNDLRPLTKRERGEQP